MSNPAFFYLHHMNKMRLNFSCHACTVVQHLTHDVKIEGSNPATGNVRDKVSKNVMGCSAAAEFSHRFYELIKELLEWSGAHKMKNKARLKLIKLFRTFSILMPAAGFQSSILGL